MANVFEGMFTSPTDIRASRLNDILKQQATNAQMGGSLAGLLGQVAAGGQTTGALMAEGTAGMFGLKTPEERKAQVLSESMQGIDPNNPDQLTALAAKLNQLGYTEQAVKIAGQARSLKREDTEDSYKAAAEARAKAMAPLELERVRAATNSSKAQSAYTNRLEQKLAQETKAFELQQTQDAQERTILSVVPIQAEETVGDWYLRVSEEGAKANRGDIAVKYKEKADAWATSEADRKYKQSLIDKAGMPNVELKPIYGFNGIEGYEIYRISADGQTVEVIDPKDLGGKKTGTPEPVTPQVDLGGTIRIIDPTTGRVSISRDSVEGWQENLPEG